MKQVDFKKLKVGDKVLTVYQGQVAEMVIDSIFDEGGQKRAVILSVPKTNEHATAYDET